MPNISRVRQVNFNRLDFLQLGDPIVDPLKKPRAFAINLFKLTESGLKEADVLFVRELLVDVRYQNVVRLRFRAVCHLLDKVNEVSLFIDCIDVCDPWQARYSSVNEPDRCVFVARVFEV